MDSCAIKLCFRQNQLWPLLRTVMLKSFNKFGNLQTDRQTDTFFSLNRCKVACFVCVIPSQGNNPAAPLTPIAQLCHLLPLSPAPSGLFFFTRVFFITRVLIFFTRVRNCTRTDFWSLCRHHTGDLLIRSQE